MLGGIFIRFLAAANEPTGIIHSTEPMQVSYTLIKEFVDRQKSRVTFSVSVPKFSPVYSMSHSVSFSNSLSSLLSHHDRL